ncbi:MAG: prepilin peptidase [Acidobacteriota bacterium]
MDLSTQEFLAELPLHVPSGFIPAWLAMFGLVIGSFLNVVIHRLPRNESVVHPRSTCPDCGHLIPWYENVPVVSWLVLRGRCSSCSRSISFRYTFVEIAAAVLCLLCWFRFGWSPTLVIAMLFALLVLPLVFTDLEHMILPDAITLNGTFVGLALSFFSPLVDGPRDAIVSVLLAIAIIEGINMLYRFLRGRDGFGAGDTKMLMMVGAFLGWKMTLLTLILGSLVGCLIGLPGLILQRLRGESEPADGEPEEENEEEEPPTGLAALQVYAPRRPEELLGLLTMLALVISVLLPFGRPAAALTGLLGGILLMKAGQALMRLRSDVDEDTPWLQRLELVPLVLTLAGLPPGRIGLGLAVGVAAAWLLVLHLRPRFLPEDDELSRLEEDEDDDAPISAPDAPLLQQALPFGVFLGLGALIALLAGPDLIDWYLSRFMPPTLGQLPPS